MILQQTENSYRETTAIPAAPVRTFGMASPAAAGCWEARRKGTALARGRNFMEVPSPLRLTKGESKGGSMEGGSWVTHEHSERDPDVGA